MSSVRNKSYFFPLLLVFSVLLSLIPLPPLMQPFRPLWLSLILIYWSLEGPHPISLGFAFALGLLVDVLLASLIGLHAIQWVVLMFLVARFSSRIRFSSLLPQTFTVFLLLLNERFILLWVLLFRGESSFGIDLWMPAIVGALIWPWLFIFLSKLRQFWYQH